MTFRKYLKVTLTPRFLSTFSHQKTSSRLKPKVIQKIQICWDIRIWSRSCDVATPPPPAGSTSFFEQELTLKGQCHEIFACSFFHQNTSPGPLIHTIKLFQIKIRIRQDIRIRSWSHNGHSPRRIRSYGGGVTPWDQQQIRISRRIRIYIRNGFRMGIPGLGDVFLFKNQRQNSSWHCPFKHECYSPG